MKYDWSYRIPTRFFVGMQNGILISSNYHKKITVTVVMVQNKAEDRAMGVQQFSCNTSATVGGPVNNPKTVETALGQTCCGNGRSKVCRTVRQNLTEAEKEARRLTRVLANRESARRTIRRRQTMYLELVGKAANLLEENIDLKKAKELVMKKYNSLKTRNEFLKGEMAKRKMAEAGDWREGQSNSSRTEISTNTTATPPIFLYNHPSLVPFFWPSIVPSSDIFNLQYTPNLDGTIPTWENPCSNQGQKGPGGISTKPGTPLFLLPVPLLLPVLTQFSTHESHPGTSQKNEISHIHQCHSCSSSVAHIQEDNHQLSSNRTHESHPGTSPKNETSHIHQCHACSSSVAHIQEDDHRLSSNRNMRAVASRHGFLEKNRRRPLMYLSRKLGNGMAASEARMKRKELMRLNSRHGHNSHGIQKMKNVGFG